RELLSNQRRSERGHERDRQAGRNQRVAHLVSRIGTEPPSYVRAGGKWERQKRFAVATPLDRPSNSANEPPRPPRGGLPVPVCLGVLFPSFRSTVSRSGVSAATSLSVYSDQRATDQRPESAPNQLTRAAPPAPSATNATAPHTPPQSHSRSRARPR